MLDHSALLRLHALSFLTVEFWDRACLPRLFSVALGEPFENLVPRNRAALSFTRESFDQAANSRYPILLGKWPLNSRLLNFSLERLSVFPIWVETL